jgi:hypothetical protein
MISEQELMTMSPQPAPHDSDPGLDGFVDGLLSDPWSADSAGLNMSSYFREKQRAQEAQAAAEEQAANPKQSADDRQLDVKLQLRIVHVLSADDLEYSRLQVDVQRKKVVLQGIVATEEKRDRAAQLASCVVGIEQVVNNIVVDLQTVRDGQRVEIAKRRAVQRKLATTVAALLLVAGGLHFWLSRGEAAPEGRVPVVPVQGQLTLDDTVPAGAMLIFHRRGPADVAHPTPMGIVRLDGTYKLTTYEAGDGAPVGEYTVTISWTPAVNEDGQPVTKLTVPKQYCTPRSSPLKTKITETTLRVPPLQVKTKL